MSSAAISFGPKLGLLNNAAIGEAYYDQLRPFLRGVDALVQGSVLSTTTTTPPGSPSNGDAYLLPTSGLSGAWSGQGGNIAVWSTQITATGGNTLTPGWDFYTPKTGWIIYANDLAELITFNGSSWVPVSSGGDFSNPMTTEGDLIVGGTVSGGVAAPARLAAGTLNDVLTSNGPGVAPSWQPAGAGADATSIQTVPVDAATPTTGQVLQFNGSEWAPATAGGGNFVNLSGAVSFAMGGGGAGSTTGGKFVVSAAGSSITISSIPGTYNHLRLLITGNNSNTQQEVLEMQFNGDATSGHYGWANFIYSAGGSGLEGNSSDSLIEVGVMGSASLLGSGSVVVDLPDYSQAHFSKQVIAQASYWNVGSYMGMFQTTGSWQPTAAITSITLTIQGGYNFTANTSVSIYGMN